MTLAPIPRGVGSLYYVLAAVGIFSLLVGATVRTRRPEDEATLHFFWLAVAFFGVRGVGSLYYLAYAAGEGEFESLPWLWSTVGFTIVLSVLVHGISAKPWLARVDARRGADGPGLASAPQGG